MDERVTNNARGFVNGVVAYLAKDKKTKRISSKVQTLLGKVTATAQKEKTAYVESAVTLTEIEKQLISQMLFKLIGHTVDLECLTTPTVLGGIRIKVADWIVDTTLETQID